MNRRSKTIALSGVLSAAAVIIMSFGNIISALSMSAAFAAGFAAVVATIELDLSAALGVYAVSGVLAFTLLPDKNIAITFIFYGGIYPILKSFCERIKNKILSWVMKWIVSNILLTVIIWLGRYFVVAGDDPLGFEIWIYLLGNFIFFAFDLAITMIITKYYILFRNRKK